MVWDIRCCECIYYKIIENIRDSLMYTLDSTHKQNVINLFRSIFGDVNLCLVLESHMFQGLRKIIQFENNTIQLTILEWSSFMVV